MGEEEPCGGAGNGGLEILYKAPASAEPRIVCHLDPNEPDFIYGFSSFDLVTEQRPRIIGTTEFSDMWSASIAVDRGQLDAVLERWSGLTVLVQNLIGPLNHCTNLQHKAASANDVDRGQHLASTRSGEKRSEHTAVMRVSSAVHHTPGGQVTDGRAFAPRTGRSTARNFERRNNQNISHYVQNQMPRCEVRYRAPRQES